MRERIDRLLILGSPGSGKSTLARTLGHATGLPFFHLDRWFFGPDWGDPDPAIWRDRVAALAAQDRWIIEGNYPNTLDLRLSRADAVLLLNLPTRLCLFRIVRRVASSHGQVRADMAPGCPERFDAAFFRYVITFRRATLPGICARLDRAEVPVRICQTRGDVARLFRAAGADPISGLARSIRENRSQGTRWTHSC